MSMISREDIRKVSKLAKLAFDEDHLGELATELNSIMTMIDSLSELDTEGVEPLRSVLDNDQRLVEDKVSEKDISGDLFKNIPEGGADLAREIKCFVVPKVVE